MYIPYKKGDDYVQKSGSGPSAHYGNRRTAQRNGMQLHLLMQLQLQDGGSSRRFADSNARE